jgi:hypothetical protein
VARDAAEEEHQDPSTVRLNYFKTTPEETSSLLDWIRRNQAASDAGNAPDYSFNYCNCAAFTIAGLIQAGAIKSNALISLIPNVLFDRLALLANENYVPPPHKPKPHVTYRILRWWFP